MALLNLEAVVVDCRQAAPMVAFYRAACGAEPDPRDEAYVRLGEVTVVFRELADYRSPTWPSSDVPMQVHLDFAVDDMVEAERRLCELGATVPEHQPLREHGLVVLLDPAGHPFCIGLPV
jgi:hypothetical protein